ncbi:hypothetical protein BB558_004968 [Smittium angustum]|uniref:Uncharacterized protein n=1 Tax=Smittium angustum TaxID=133377 RepID=A0A2U1J1V8_SMIAN|nr:hypothetical protein BB558_004968 [Smittium angustum]
MKSRNSLQRQPTRDRATSFSSDTSSHTFSTVGSLGELGLLQKNSQIEELHLLPLDVKENVVATFCQFCSTKDPKEQSNTDSHRETRNFTDIFSSLEQLDWALSAMCLGFLLPLEDHELIRRSTEVYLDILFKFKDNQHNLKKANKVFPLKKSDLGKYLLAYCTRLSILFNPREIFKDDEIRHLGKVYQVLGDTTVPEYHRDVRKSKQPVSVFISQRKKEISFKELYSKSGFTVKRKSVFESDSGEDNENSKKNNLKNFSKRQSTNQNPSPPENRKYFSDPQVISQLGSSKQKSDFTLAKLKTNSLNDTIPTESIAIKDIEQNEIVENNSNKSESQNEEKSDKRYTRISMQSLNPVTLNQTGPRKAFKATSSTKKHHSINDIYNIKRKGGNSSGSDFDSSKGNTAGEYDKLKKHSSMNVNVYLGEQTLKPYINALSKEVSPHDISVYGTPKSEPDELWGELSEYSISENEKTPQPSKPLLGETDASATEIEKEDALEKAKRNKKARKSRQINIRKSKKKNQRFSDIKKKSIVNSPFITNAKENNVAEVTTNYSKLSLNDLAEMNNNRTSSTFSNTSNFTFEVPKKNTENDLNFYMSIQSILDRPKSESKFSFFQRSPTDIDYTDIDRRDHSSMFSSVTRESLFMQNLGPEVNYAPKKLEEVGLLWDKHILLLNDIFQFFSTALRSFSSAWNNEIMGELQIIILIIVDVILSQGGKDPRRKEWESHYKNILGPQVWNKTWENLGEELVKPALKISINIWFLSKHSENEKTLKFFENRLVYWFHRTEVVDLWLQLYGQVILRQLRADYGEIDCVGVEKIKMSTPRFKMSVKISRTIAFRMWKFISGLKIQTETCTLKSYIMYTTALTQIVKVMASIGKTESQVEYFREANEILLPPPINYILDLCGKALLTIASDEQVKGDDFAKARMRVTIALSKLLCTKEMSENYNDPVNYSLLLALEEGFRGDSEMQAILKEAPALIGLNPNARAYLGHMFRAIELTLPLESKNMVLYQSRDEVRNWALKTLLAILSMPKYYYSIGSEKIVSKSDFISQRFQGDMFGIFRAVRRFSGRSSEAVKNIENHILGSQELFLKKPEFADLLVEILMVILGTLLDEKNPRNYILILRITTLFVSEYSTILKGSLKAIVVTMLNKIKISLSDPEVIDHTLLSLSHIAQQLKFMDVDTEELVFCKRKIAIVLSKCDSKIYKHSDYDYNHQRFFVSSKCLFSWLSLCTKDNQVDLGNYKIGTKILQRLVEFISQHTKKNHNTRNRKTIEDQTPEKSLKHNIKVNKPENESDNESSVSMDEGEFFNEYMEDIKDNIGSHSGLLKIYNKSSTPGNTSRSVKGSSWGLMAGSNSPVPESILNKKVRYSRYEEKNKTYTSNIILNSTLRDSLEDVALSLGVTLFSSVDIRDMISKCIYTKRTKKNRKLDDEECFDIGLDLIIAKKHLGENQKQKTSDVYFYMINNTLTSRINLVPNKKYGMIPSPTLLTSRNINGRYTSIIVNGPECDFIGSLDTDYKNKNEIEDISSENGFRNKLENRFAINSPEGVSEKINKLSRHLKSKSDDITMKSKSGKMSIKLKKEHGKTALCLIKEKVGSIDDIIELPQLSEKLASPKISKPSIVIEDTEDTKVDYLSQSIESITKIGLKDEKHTDTKKVSFSSTDTKDLDGDDMSNVPYDLMNYRIDSPESESFIDSGINDTSDKKLINNRNNMTRSRSLAQNLSVGSMLGDENQIGDSKTSIPWSRSVGAERRAMSRSLARDARGFSSLREDRLPNLRDIKSTTIMSQIIRNDIEKRLNAVNEDSSAKHFKPVTPHNTRKQKTYHASRLQGVNKSFMDSLAHVPIQLSEELLRDIMLIDCLNSTFMMRVNVVCVESHHSAISKGIECFTNKMHIPPDLMNLLESLGKKVTHNKNSLGFGLSSHTGFQHKSSLNNVLFQLAPNLIIPQKSKNENSKKIFDFDEKSTGFKGCNEYGRHKHDSFFNINDLKTNQRKLSLDSQKLDKKNKKERKHYSVVGVKGAEEFEPGWPNIAFKDVNALNSTTPGSTNIDEMGEKVQPGCLIKFFKSILQDGIVLIYVPSGIENVSMHYFWEKVMSNYPTLDPVNYNVKSKKQESNSKEEKKDKESKTNMDKAKKKIKRVSFEGFEDKSVEYDVNESVQKNDIDPKLPKKSSLKKPTSGLTNESDKLPEKDDDTNSVNRHSKTKQTSHTFDKEKLSEINSKKGCKYCLNSDFDLFDIIEQEASIDQEEERSEKEIQEDLESRPRFAILICPIIGTKGTSAIASMYFVGSKEELVVTPKRELFDFA